MKTTKDKGKETKVKQNLKLDSKEFRTVKPTERERRRFLMTKQQDKMNVYS